MKALLPDKTQRAVDLAYEKGASNWLTVIPLKDMDFDPNKMPATLALRVMLGLIHLFQLYASPIDKSILANGIV